MASNTSGKRRTPMITGGSETTLLETSGIVSLRILAIAAVGYIGYLGFIRVRSVALAIITALLIGSVLQPLTTKLRALGIPRALAAAIVFIGSLLVLTMAASLIVGQVVAEAPEIEERATEAVQDLSERLTEAPFNMDSQRLDNIGTEISDWVQRSGVLNANVAASVGGFATSAFSGLFIALTVLFFICKDGDKFPSYLAALVGDGRAERLNRAGGEIWSTTASYLRGVGLTGLADGIMIGIGLAVLGVPLAIPLALLTFLGAFIPVVGATLAGMLAAAVALATNGPTTALIVVAIVIAVQQIEGTFLAPLLLGRAVQLHPVTILLSLAVGGTVAGIWGALLAVPAAAAIRIALAEFVPGVHRVDELEIANAAAASAARHGSPDESVDDHQALDQELFEAEEEE